MSYLTLAQWADPNTLAARDIWMRLTNTNPGPPVPGPWREFMLPPFAPNVPGCPPPILERSTLVAQGSAAMPLGGQYSLLSDRPSGYLFDLPNAHSTTAVHTIIGMIHVNIWCGMMTFDRFFHQLPVEDSHLVHMTWLRQFRDACISSPAGQNTIDLSTDQATHIETFYIHSYKETILPWALPNRDWVVDLVLINPAAGTGGGIP